MKTQIASILASVLVTASCQTFVIDFENGAPVREPTQKQAQASMWLGLQEVSNPVNVSCPREPAQIVIKRTPLDFLVHFTIGGVYTRISTAVYCPL